MTCIFRYQFLLCGEKIASSIFISTLVYLGGGVSFVNTYVTYTVSE